MMKIFKPLLFMLLLLTLPTCHSEQNKINVLEAEGWTDLMPNAGGRTYIHLQLKIYDYNENMLSISGLDIRHGEDQYNLTEGEFIYMVETEGKSLIVDIKTNLMLKDNGENEIEAGIRYTLEGNSNKLIISDISIDEVN